MPWMNCWSVELTSMPELRVLVAGRLSTLLPSRGTG
ncbi:hypothetical protein LINPERHAP1_LOCUS31500 [Linum perenne]